MIFFDKKGCIKEINIIYYIACSKKETAKKEYQIKKTKKQRK